MAPSAWTRRQERQASSIKRQAASLTAAGPDDIGK